MNFTKPTENKPALLTFNEVETFLHEFGHSLHGMFANSTYRSLSGTNVYWDFVELPSQIMENFAIEKDFLNTFARHYQTGEVLPDELIKRLVDASIHPAILLPCDNGGQRDVYKRQIYKNSLKRLCRCLVNTAIISH